MDLSLSALRSAYKSKEVRTIDVVEYILSRVDDPDQKSVWISTNDANSVRLVAEALDARLHDIDKLPLFGLPFSVKDNIDVAGQPTTAACPDFAYTAEESAFVVEKAIEAGAIYIGKTNLDQFATGLVGVRSPYGIPVNPHNSDYIPGGSSAGAGVSVSTGMVTFAFGTDTGGSGRVPASYNAIAGFKPAPGLMSRKGLVFACRSIDTASIFANTAQETIAIFDAVAQHDPMDPYNDAPAYQDSQTKDLTRPWKISIPRNDDLQFFGNEETKALFNQAVERLSTLTEQTQTIDFSQFTALNDLMFFGPLLAERDVSVGAFVDKHPDSCDPIVRSLIQGSRKYTAAEAYAAQYKIADARASTAHIWDSIDAIMVPTVGDVYTLEALANDPLQLNFNNGYYTNFANPMGLSAIATPFGTTNAGVPWGVTFLCAKGGEKQLARIAEQFSSSL